ncbi:hypothetical protein D3C80_1481930 [compost metagenome]
MEALACGQLQPVPAQRQILGHLFTRQIGLPQPQLSGWRTRIGGTLIKGKRLCRVCLASQGQQGIRLLLGGSLFIPTPGKVGTLAHPLALLIAQAEPILSVTIPLLGGLFQPLNRIGIGAGLAGVPLTQNQLSTSMIPFGSLLEPVETRAH